MATRFRTRLMMLVLLGVIGYPTLCHHLSTNQMYFRTLAGTLRPSNYSGPRYVTRATSEVDGSVSFSFNVWLPWPMFTHRFSNEEMHRANVDKSKCTRWGLPVAWLHRERCVFDNWSSQQIEAEHPPSAKPSEITIYVDSTNQLTYHYRFLINPFPPLIVLGLAIGGPYLLARRKNADRPEPRYVPVVRCLFAGAVCGFVSGWGYVLSSAMLFGSPILTVPFDRWQPAAYQAAGYLFGAAVGPYLFRMLVLRSPEPA